MKAAFRPKSTPVAFAPARSNRSSAIFRLLTIANLASAGVLLWLAWDTGLQHRRSRPGPLAIAILTLWIYGYWADHAP